MQYFIMFLLVITGLFLILVVLIQRGRGGGLSGAFGGMGGQSAFGTKAGDLFTRITIGVAAFWIILCAVSVKLLGNAESKFSSSLGGASQPEEAPGATGGKADDKKPGATGEKSAPAKQDDEPSSAPESKPATKEASPPVERSTESPAPDQSK